MSHQNRQHLNAGGPMHVTSSATRPTDDRGDTKEHTPVCGRLILVRHGSTEYNRQDRYQGRMDLPLCNIGEEQIERVLLEISQYEIAQIISSPLLRAVQSARILAEELKCEHTLMPHFTERCMGVFEGLPRKEAKNRFPFSSMNVHDFNWAPPTGETLLDVATRVNQGLLSLPACSPTTVLVTHGTVAKVVHWLFGKIPDTRFFQYSLANGAYQIYQMNELPNNTTAKIRAIGTAGGSAI